MGRAWRIEYEGAYYHLMSRGNNGQDIFLADNDRRQFLETLSEVSERFEMEIFAYVLMSNHYHLLVQTHRANLKKAMHWLGTTYTRRFNNRHARGGHLFQGRYKSILVENDAYLTQLSCYIHRNPLKAGIVKRLMDYPWSSYGAYAYGRKSPEWLSTNLILSHFNGPDPHKEYREKVQHYAGEEQRLAEEIRHGLILGSQKFTDDIRERFLPDDSYSDVPQQKELAKAIDPVDMVTKISKAIGVDVNSYIRSRRVRGTNKERRDLIVYFIWHSGYMTNTEIGKLFNMSYSAVSHSVKSFKEKMSKNRKLKEEFESLNSQFKL